MMRYLFVTLLGFFGPALLILLFRLTWFQLRQKWFSKKSEPEIIDVTPSQNRYPNKLVIIGWLFISLICTAFLFEQMDDSPAPKRTYIPAHIDAKGQFVPAQSLEEKRTVDKPAQQNK